MYEQEDDYAEEGEDSEEISNEIWQEACWIVISAYFDEKGEILLRDLAVLACSGVKGWKSEALRDACCIINSVFFMKIIVKNLS